MAPPVPDTRRDRGKKCYHAGSIHTTRWTISGPVSRGALFVLHVFYYSLSTCRAGYVFRNPRRVSAMAHWPQCNRTPGHHYCRRRARLQRFMDAHPAAQPPPPCLKPAHTRIFHLRTLPANPNVAHSTPFPCPGITHPSFVPVVCLASRLHRILLSSVCLDPSLIPVLLTLRIIPLAYEIFSL